MNAKTCIHCHELHPLEHFYRDIYRPDGRRNICRDCEKLTRQERQIRVTAELMRKWNRIEIPDA